MVPQPAFLPAQDQLFGYILPAQQPGRGLTYGEKINSIGRELSALVNEVFSRFPAVIDDRGRLSAWNELVDRARELMLYYVDFYKENPGAPPPTRDTMLVELKVRVGDTGLKSAIDSLRGARPAVPFQGPQLEQPRTLPEIPAREEAAPAPARRAAPTIASLREHGYGNIIDSNIGGKIYRFAAKDPSLDVIGMGPEKLLQYALEHPGELRIFEVDRSGYATRELRSERELGRLRERIAGQA